jgi:hypothetical protein
MYVYTKLINKKILKRFNCLSLYFITNQFSVYKYELSRSSKRAHSASNDNDTAASISSLRSINSFFRLSLDTSVSYD